MSKPYDQVEKTGRALDQETRTFESWYASSDAKSTDDGMYTKDVLASIQDKFGSQTTPSARLITMRLKELCESDPNRVKLLHKDKKFGSCFKINPPHSQGGSSSEQPASSSLEPSAFLANECMVRDIPVKRVKSGKNAGEVASTVTMDQLRQKLIGYHKGAVVIPRMTDFQGSKIEQSRRFVSSAPACPPEV